MTFFGMALLTAAGTIVLAVFAIVAAWYARKAFLKQSQEVAAVERQVTDGQELTSQQAELLKVQAGQLEVMHGQLEDQIKASARQAEVVELQRRQLKEQEKTSAEQARIFALQAEELQASLRERERVADERKRSQAAGVITWIRKGRDAQNMYAAWGALVRNASDLPVFNVRVFFHQVNYRGVDWAPVSVGSHPPDETVIVLPPGAELFVQIPQGVASMFGAIEISDRTCLAALEFVDAAGHRWERDPRGALGPLD